MIPNEEHMRNCMVFGIKKFVEYYRSDIARELVSANYRTPNDILTDAQNNSNPENVFIEFCIPLSENEGAS